MKSLAITEGSFSQWSVHHQGTPHQSRFVRSTFVDSQKIRAHIQYPPLGII